jgi:PEP-CTERM motif-containing protein
MLRLKCLNLKKIRRVDMKLKKLLLGLTSLCFIIMVGQHVHAQSITYSDSYTELLTELGDEPLRVDFFNTALGTLTSVEVTMSGSLQSFGSVTNTASQNQAFTISTRAQLYDGSLVSGSPNVLPDNFSIFTSFGLIGEQIYTDLSPKTPTPFGPLAANSGSLTVFSTTDPGELALFEGLGQFGYDFATLILTSITGGGGNVLTSIETLASATINVEYDYNNPTQTPIPEPATMTLLGLGLAGLSFTCRRKLKKSNLSGDR